jgi:hypothetical protein
VGRENRNDASCSNFSVHHRAALAPNFALSSEWKKTPPKKMRAVLNRWEMAYNKENFYRGTRILLELQRNGSSKL